METVKRTGGGSFDPAENQLYFLAGQPFHLEQLSGVVAPRFLVPLNELEDWNNVLLCRDWAAAKGHALFLDSGSFHMAMDHANAHGLHLNQAFALPPSDLDGFDHLFDLYVAVLGEVKDVVWGYVEIDLGSPEQKTATRTRLELLGFSPIPVFHPLSDGWDYFDYLAKRYDRIGIGNLARSAPPVRLRVLATLWERHRQYPNLWLHLLGYTPNQLLNAYPVNSGDSSYWLNFSRFGGGLAARADGASLGQYPSTFRSNLGEGPGEAGAMKGRGLWAYSSALDAQNWRGHLDALGALGFVQYPPVTGDPDGD